MKLLEILDLNFSKTTLVESISCDTLDGDESSVSIHISSLRSKLKQVSNKDYIETVWGVGFKMH